MNQFGTEILRNIRHKTFDLSLLVLLDGLLYQTQDFGKPGFLSNELHKSLCLFQIIY